MMQDGSGFIFIYGVLQRSGTNYLSRLLSYHPDVQQHPSVHEDWLLFHASDLAAFSTAISRRWQTSGWNIEADDSAGLMLAFGSALLAYLEQPVSEAGWLVLKTPSLWNLHLADAFFPKAKKIVIVRDGRDLIASGIRTFGWEFEHAVRRYAQAASYLGSNQATCEFLLLRYEDLIGDLAGSINKVLEYIGLDLDSYTFDLAFNAPVVGSSQQAIRVGTQNRDFWKPVRKNADFNSLNRWQGWSRFRKERFRWLAGDSLVALGYEAGAYHQFPFMARLIHSFLDLVWKIQRRLRRYIRKTAS